ncbi:MAG: bifunctional homocysteine S-methyltransferase/methylenetetrahydrofolate reductase [Phycisphaeraceae bacterium]|nr:bifunctional homocysteine S-methyltransferase/methylenetetrahydrofolate reductase [Phycisphaeraceae bacterium]
MAARGQAFFERLAEQVVIGDGAMGSRLYELGMSLGGSSDALNLARPDLVRQVHEEYLAAGAQLLETNTFSANSVRLAAFGLAEQVAAINRKGVELAKAAAGDRAFVSGAVGPLPALAAGDNLAPLTEQQARAAFRQQISLLAEAGVDVIQLETFTDLDQLRWALQEARACCDLPVIAQMTLPDGRHAPDGHDAHEALQSLRDQGADVVGTNCGHGVSRVLRAVEYLAARTDAPLSAYPNAGMPEQVDGRLLYLTTPAYVAEAAARMADCGANLIGGCCGTTAAHIAAIAQRLGQRKPARRAARIEVKPAPQQVTAVAAPPTPPDFLEHRKDRIPVLVELDPPKTTDMAKLLESAAAVKEAGADAVTLGDSPLAQLRMCGFTAGAAVMQQVGIPVICHLSCRDRNLIGTQGLLLGAHVQGIRNVLALTGDPAKVGNHPDAASVYDLNSFSLIEMIVRLNQGVNAAGQSIGKPTAFHVGVAFNPNKRDITPELRRLERKVERGATYALTQAVFDAATMQRACAAARHLGIPIFAGVFPLLSVNHAEFLHNEFPGITICDAVRQRMAKAAPDKQRMAEEGMAIARELIDEFSQCADGLYLIPPLNRARVAVELLHHIRRRKPSDERLNA